MSLIGFELLDLLLCQKSMVLDFIENDHRLSLSLLHKEELLELEKKILKLNSKGIIERRTSDRRIHSTDVELEKRVERRRRRRRTIASRIIAGSYKHIFTTP